MSSAGFLLGLAQVSPRGRLLSSLLASGTADPQRFTAVTAPALPTSGPSFSLHPLFFLHQARNTSQPVASGFSHPDAQGSHSPSGRSRPRPQPPSFLTRPSFPPELPIKASSAPAERPPARDRIPIPAALCSPLPGHSCPSACSCLRLEVGASEP